MRLHGVPWLLIPVLVFSAGCTQPPVAVTLAYEQERAAVEAFRADFMTVTAAYDEHLLAALNQQITLIFKYEYERLVGAGPTVDAKSALTLFEQSLAKRDEVAAQVAAVRATVQAATANVQAALAIHDAIARYNGRRAIRPEDVAELAATAADLYTLYRKPAQETSNGN